MLQFDVSKQKVDSFFTRLKNETATMHERLEDTRLSKALISNDVSIDNYLAYLQSMKGIIDFFEDAIFTLVSPIIPDIADRKKAHLIRNDFDFFKGAAANDRSYRPFKAASIPFALGYFYVIEGSTLGGRVLLKHLQPRLAVTAHAGGSFFAGYEEKTSIMWKTFLQQLGTYALENNCEEEIIEGAKHAFLTIYNHFELRDEHP